jgi:hypothetical protein
MTPGGRRRLRVVFTTDEHAEIADAAHQAGVTQAGHCARAALDAAPGTHDPTEHAELQALAHLQVELFRIRVALNEVRSTITDAASTSTAHTEYCWVSAQAARSLTDLDQLVSRIHQRIDQRLDADRDAAIPTPQSILP